MILNPRTLLITLAAWLLLLVGVLATPNSGQSALGGYQPNYQVELGQVVSKPLNAIDIYLAFKKAALGFTNGSDGTLEISAGTVWDNINATAKNIPNTHIPSTFKLKSGDSEFYVNSNATKHMGEYLQNSSNPINDQMLLNSFSNAVNDITSSGSIQFGKMYSVGGWDVVFSQRVGDKLPVIKHALYRP